jgi:hypothetical protein
MTPDEGSRLGMQRFQNVKFKINGISLHDKIVAQFRHRNIISRRMKITLVEVIILI